MSAIISPRTRLDGLNNFVAKHAAWIFCIAIATIAIVSISNHREEQAKIVREQGYIPIGPSPIKDWVRKHHPMERDGISTSAPMEARD